MNRKEFDAISKQINQFSIVCFDLFDTLLDRVYSTKYSFYVAADRLIEEYGLNRSIGSLATR